MPAEPTVFVVDDDAQARNSVCALARSMGLHAQPFASAEEFFDQCDPDPPGCLVTDLRLLGMSGIELLELLPQRRILLPVIVLTAYARTATTVRAIQSGAVTVLDKPYAEDDLWDAIRTALVRDAHQRAERSHREEVRHRLAQLTPAERQVLSAIVAGHANKVIARELGVSLRTVENRRQEVFTKMQVETLADLIRAALEVEANGD